MGCGIHTWLAIPDQDAMRCTGCGAVVTARMLAVRQAQQRTAAKVAVHHNQEASMMDDEVQHTQYEETGNEPVSAQELAGGTTSPDGEQTDTSTPVAGAPDDEPTGAPANAAHEEQRYLQDEAHGIDDQSRPVGQRNDDEAQIVGGDPEGEPFDTAYPDGAPYTVDPARDAENVNNELGHRTDAMAERAENEEAVNEAANEADQA